MCAYQAGDLVCLHDIVSRVELNGKWGVVNSFLKDKGRYSINVGPTESFISLKTENVTKMKDKVSAKYKYLEIWPVDSRVVKSYSQIPVSAVFGGIPSTLEMESGELEFLRNPQKFIANSPRSAWKNPVGVKAYTKSATYPDIYMYFDADDTKSARNVFASSFSPYPEDIGDQYPCEGIRGNAVVVRMEPPFAISGGGSTLSDQMPSMMPQFKMPNMTQAMPENIRIQELQDSLWNFFHEADCVEHARLKDRERVLGDMPPELRASLSLGNSFAQFKFPSC